ncbi:hypothetical protein MMC10_002952 [Thelotrema lepadinum]|nr:hypothetical protein [Thelotrema lepadinum]
MPSNPTSDLILVTCASGKQAAKLIPLLYTNYSHLRLAVNSPSSKERLQAAYPNAEVVQADSGSYQDVRSLFRGVTTVYYVGPSSHHHETQCGYHAIDAALAERKESGGNFKHFVFSSVLNTQLRKLMNHDCKRYVEERLYESGLDYTVLKPCNFIDMFPIEMMAKQEEPVYPAPWDIRVANSLIMLEDLAEVSMKVINEREHHFFAEYPLCSTLPVPYKAMVDSAEKVLKKKVTVKDAPFEVRTEKMTKLILGDDPHPQSVDAAERLILWHERHELNGSPNVMRALLGREPMTIDQWMEKGVKSAKEGH